MPLRTIFHGKKSSQPEKTPSRNVYIGTIIVVLILGFIGGTYQHQIENGAASLLGLRTQPSLNLSSLENLYSILKNNYYGTLDDQALIDGAEHGLVAAAGDKYTLFMDAKQASDFTNALDGSVGSGIGAEIELVNNQPMIQDLLPDNPGVKAGLQVGDVISAVNGSSTAGWSAAKVASTIRGKAGTSVTLTIKRNSQTKDYTITRATINNPSVNAVIKNGIGILTISRFDNETGSLADKAAQTFKQHGVKGVILDLRDNGGGYVNAAQAVASLWLNNKTIATEQKNGIVQQTITSGTNPLLAGLPTVVLVNQNSASASEIVSGALQYYKVATLIGQQTYGKGSVQEIFNLSGGDELKVTVDLWDTPDNRNINGVGLKPDKVVPLSQADLAAGNDPQLQAAFAMLPH